MRCWTIKTQEIGHELRAISVLKSVKFTLHLKGDVIAVLEILISVSYLYLICYQILWPGTEGQSELGRFSLWSRHSHPDTAHFNTFYYYILPYQG